MPACLTYEDPMKIVTKVQTLQLRKVKSIFTHKGTFFKVKQSAIFFEYFPWKTSYKEKKMLKLVECTI